MDLIKIRRIQSAYVAFFYICYIFKIQIGLWYAKIIVIFVTNIVCLINATAQVILTVKAIFIFKPGWIADIEEDEIIVLARVAEIAYVGVRFVLDYSLPERYSRLIDFYTGIKMNT